MWKAFKKGLKETTLFQWVMSGIATALGWYVGSLVAPFSLVLGFLTTVVIIFVVMVIQAVIEPMFKH